MPVKCPKCQAENPETKQFCANRAAPLVRADTLPETERSVGQTETMAMILTELRTGATFAGRYEVIAESEDGRRRPEVL